MNKNQSFLVAGGYTYLRWHSDCRRTQYGYTCESDGLELHMGNHLFRKRGGPVKAFVLDAPDYRYESLMKSLGLPFSADMHFLLGVICDHTDDLIRFRVTEDGPSDILIAVPDEKGRAILTSACFIPDAITRTENGYAYLVYSLSRYNSRDEDAELYDNLYDCEADPVDLTAYHYNREVAKEMTSPEAARYRLHLCGF